MKLLNYLNNYAVCAPHVVISIPIAEAGRLTDDNLQAVQGSTLMEAFWFEEQDPAKSYLVFILPNTDKGGVNVDMQSIDKSEYMGHGGIWKMNIKEVPSYVQFIPLMPHPVLALSRH
jgi:hypothetical protein